MFEFVIPLSADLHVRKRGYTIVESVRAEKFLDECFQRDYLVLTPYGWQSAVNVITNIDPKLGRVGICGISFKTVNGSLNKTTLTEDNLLIDFTTQKEVKVCNAIGKQILAYTGNTTNCRGNFIHTNLVTIKDIAKVENVNCVNIVLNVDKLFVGSLQIVELPNLSL